MRFWLKADIRDRPLAAYGSVAARVPNVALMDHPLALGSPRVVAKGLFQWRNAADQIVPCT